MSINGLFKNNNMPMSQSTILLDSHRLYYMFKKPNYSFKKINVRYKWILKIIIWNFSHEIMVMFTRYAIPTRSEPSLMERRMQKVRMIMTKRTTNTVDRQCQDLHAPLSQICPHDRTPNHGIHRFNRYHFYYSCNWSIIHR